MCVGVRVTTDEVVVILRVEGGEGVIVNVLVGVNILVWEGVMVGVVEIVREGVMVRV